MTTHPDTWAQRYPIPAPPPSDLEANTDRASALLVNCRTTVDTLTAALESANEALDAAREQLHQRLNDHLAAIRDEHSDLTIDRPTTDRSRPASRTSCGHTREAEPSPGDRPVVPGAAHRRADTCGDRT